MIVFSVRPDSLSPYTNHGWHAVIERNITSALIAQALADEQANAVETEDEKLLCYSRQCNLLLVISPEGKLISAYFPTPKQRKRWIPKLRGAAL